MFLISGTLFILFSFVSLILNNLYFMDYNDPLLLFLAIVSFLTGAILIYLEFSQDEDGD